MFIAVIWDEQKRRRRDFALLRIALDRSSLDSLRRAARTSDWDTMTDDASGHECR
jgi:hypothetical protein